MAAKRDDGSCLPIGKNADLRVISTRATLVEAQCLIETITSVASFALATRFRLLVPDEIRQRFLAVVVDNPF